MILTSIIVLGFLGLICALILEYFSKKFAVNTDEKLELIIACLPGLNCGACGKPSCEAFAKDLEQSKEQIDGCKLGGLKTEEKLALILDVKVKVEEQKIARVICNGGTNCMDLFEYNGILQCKGAALISGGQKACTYSCLGFGDCVLVCPVDAIAIGKQRIPIIDSEKCIGCEKCVKECPKKIIEMIKKSQKVWVMCSSKDIGTTTSKKCIVGCIACRICEKVCPEKCINVNENIAKIDYSHCINCGICSEKCPKKIINNLEKIKK